MLCGSLCVNYVIKKITKKVINIDPNMLWSTDLALCLMNVLNNKIMYQFWCLENINKEIIWENYL